MTPVKNGKHFTLLVPDDYLGGKVATLDESGWLTIGYVGESAVMIDPSEWASFVKFMNEIDAYRGELNNDYPR